MKLLKNNRVYDISVASKVVIDEYLITVSWEDESMDLILDINNTIAFSKLRERHNDWECEIIDHIVDMVAEDFFELLKQEIREDKTLDYEDTIIDLLNFYISENY